MIYDFKQKQFNVRQLNQYMLAKTLSMFEYENLPESIPQRELEYLLQTNGYAFITEINGELYALAGSIGGEIDAYNRPKDITINNVPLNFNKTLSIADDGILISSDDMMMGLIPMYEKHNTLLIENDINMVLHGYNTRIKTLISASDDKTKDSADKYLKKIIDGEVGIIGENALFDGVRVQGSNSGHSSSITSMTEYHQYVKASLYNEIGLSANFNMKRERLTSGEVDQSDESLFPFVYNMMDCRLSAMKRLNKMYDLDVKVGFGSVWYDKQVELVDHVVGNNEVSRETILPVNEPSHEPSHEPLKVTPTEIDAAKTIDELLEMLKDENLSDDDIQAIDDLIKEIEGDKQDD